jgi:hypothetical protein
VKRITAKGKFTFHFLRSLNSLNLLMSEKILQQLSKQGVEKLLFIMMILMEQKASGNCLNKSNCKRVKRKGLTSFTQQIADHSGGDKQTQH